MIKEVVSYDNRKYNFPMCGSKHINLLIQRKPYTHSTVSFEEILIILRCHVLILFLVVSFQMISDLTNYPINVIPKANQPNHTNIIRKF